MVLKEVLEYEITPGIILFVFPTQQLMTKTFLRFQEHYESPMFRGKFFSRDEFEVWYNGQKGANTDGSCKYYDDWNGFNVPSLFFNPFYQGKFDPLDAYEKALLDRLKKRKHPFYVIAIHARSQKPALKHEIAHGLFYANPGYKKEILAALKGMNVSSIFKYLEESDGYHPDVWQDEVHAHILSSRTKLEEKDVDFQPYEEMLIQLEIIFEKYFKPKNNIELKSLIERYDNAEHELKDDFKFLFQKQQQPL